MTDQKGYVYLRAERQLWTVGYYEPNGTWNPESDHGTVNEAAERVRYLNGGEVHQLTQKDMQIIKGLQEPNYLQIGNVAFCIGREGYITFVKFHPTGWEGRPGAVVTVYAAGGYVNDLHASDVESFLMWWEYDANVQVQSGGSWLMRALPANADADGHVHLAALDQELSEAAQDV